MGKSREEIRALYEASKPPEPPISDEERFERNMERARLLREYKEEQERKRLVDKQRKEQRLVDKQRKEQEIIEPEFIHLRKQVNAQNARARAVGVKGKLTANEWGRLCEKHGHRCLRCQKEGKLTIDHVIPLSEGGTNTIDNIQPLCRVCNAKKSAKLVEDYRPRDRAYIRMAIEAILRDEVKGQWSDREIAREVGCSHGTVGTVRARMVADAEIPHLSERIVFRKKSRYVMAKKRSRPC